LIACYPVITFGPERHDGSMRALLGAEPDPALREELSIENAVSAANPPAFIWHSADDGAVPVANSLKLAASHARHAVPFALHVYPKAWHGVNLALDQPGTVQRWPADCAAWLAELGWR
jgi:acetyl esterase/lipase